MLEYMLVYIFVIFIATPVLVLAHELGHAVPMLMFTTQSIIIEIVNWQPREDKLFAVNIGRLQINWWVLPGWAGRCRSNSDALPPLARLLISIGGPFTSFGLWIIFAVGAYLVDGYLEAFLVGCAFHTFITLLITTVPWRYPSWFGIFSGSLSDGAKALQALRELCEGSTDK